MSDNDLIRRIESLNKRPLKHVPEPCEEPEKPERPARMERPERPERPVQRTREPELICVPEPVKLEDVVAGVPADTRHGYHYYQVESEAEDTDVCAELVHCRFVQLTGHPGGRPVAPIADGCSLETLDPERVVFMDIETAGLRGCPLFLIGTMWSNGKRFHFKQYLARDYSEEAGVICAFAEDLADMHLLVTFNGIRFDLPFIVGRGSFHGLRVRYEGAHLDLLLEARKRYRGETPNCKLQTLERVICGREREDDIPGSQIPQAYDDFVFSGDASQIATILRHIRLDLLTLPELMYRMWREE